jgi:CheY-like chemotaxis protein
MSYRVLHIDDDPLMRDVVEHSLNLDPALTLASCASGDEALAVASEWPPDLILCDVMMPEMDGPAVLARLRETKSTAEIPVVFMTARARAIETDRLTSLGACGVIAKPFNPKTLAETVRGHLHSIRLASDRSDLPARMRAEAAPQPPRYNFVERLRTDASTLTTFRQRMMNDPESELVPDEFLSCVHKLAGAAGVFQYPAVSTMASALEDSMIEARHGRDTPETIRGNLDDLLECIARESLKAGDEHDKRD